MQSAKRYLKIGLALAVLSALLLIVRPAELWEAISQLTLSSLCYLALISILLILVSCIKWRVFIRALGSDVPLLRLFNLYLVGYFVNTVVPSYVGGDAVRSWYVGKNIGQHEAAAATILERFTGIVAMMVLALTFVWFSELATWQIKLIVVLMALGLAGITAAVMSDRLYHLLEKLPYLKQVTRNLKKVRESFGIAARDRSVVVKALLLSFLYHSLTVINTMVAAWAVGWLDVSFQEVMVVLPVILLIGALPFTPSGLGLQEGAFMVFLSGIGATSAQALAIGVVLRAKAYILALIGGLIWMWLREHKAKGTPELLASKRPT
ncbi:MAG: flippase-like domain-containing protein [Oligoflexia bacterium]|nr:flippase-like domain-containing protein [Oligoflexia bacterium]